MRSVLQTAPKLVVDIPRNTMFADVDDALELLLRRELPKVGFDDVAVAFDAPSRDWSAQLTRPTLNLFLYDVREAADRRRLDLRDDHGGDRVLTRRPRLLLETTYAVSGWSLDVRDEHRLLSQAVQILFGHAELPGDVLSDRLALVAEQDPLEMEVGRPREIGKADFWSTFGGAYRPCVDLLVYVACESPVAVRRGPEVRSQSTGVAPLRTPGVNGAIDVEQHRYGGRLLDPGGRPVSNAWVTLPDIAKGSTTDIDGRFRFDKVPRGQHRLVARTDDGQETKRRVVIPGAFADLYHDGAAEEATPSEQADREVQQ